MSNQDSSKTSVQQDLRDARGLLEQSGSEEEKRKYRKAAEIILIKALRLDPDNEEANILLQSVRGVPVTFVPSPSPVKAPAPPPPPAEESLRDDDLSFTATATAPPLFASLGRDRKKKAKSKVLFGLIFIVALGGLIWIEQMHGMSSRATSASYTPAPSAQIPAPSNVTASTSAMPAPSDAKLTVTSAPASAPPIAPIQVAETTRPAPAPAPVAAPAAPAAPLFGKLAVSSPTAADIYQGEKYLGSTPATLQLPAGPQTLEYRHGALRTVITHEIKADQTTSASVAFATTVQINAKPWAHVFVDGAQRRELGQTPLSGISIPIGSVLVFENPKFTAKTHRVTENDTTIQVDFQ